MGRPRGFDEARAVAAAAELFARRSYDGTSVDDLVTQTGVHRGSLYKTFGSKRGLYLAALRHHVDVDVAGFAAGPPRPDLRFLLLATAERVPVDDDVAAEVARAVALLDEATRPLVDGTATLLGLLLLNRPADAEALLNLPKG